MVKIGRGEDLFIVISRLRYKILAILRFLLAIAIMAILVGQLFNLVMEAGGFYNKWFDYEHPSGNPMRVFKNYQDWGPYLDTGDGMINWLKEYYKKD